MSKTVGREIVRELESNLVLLVYDIPYPPKGGDRKRLAPWFSWYDWATSTLRYLGYPLQYSVVVVDEHKIGEVEEAVKRIEEKRISLNKHFGLEIPKPRISVIRFSLKTRSDAEALFSIIREGLKGAIKAFIEEVEEQLREGRDRTKLQERVRNFVKRLEKQDFLKLLLRDLELRNMFLQLEILTA